MTTITREQAQKIIEAADDVINAIAGNHDDVSPESDGMLRLWDDLNDRYAPPEVVRELARIALASLTAEPVAWTDAEELRDLRTVGFCEMFTVEPVSKDADMYRVIPLYTDSPVPERERIRHEHAEWSYATFGDVGPVGPLKHLSKEALEAAAEPDDLSEWADMQFLLWDAQRRAGVTDEQITMAMVEKLAINKARQWPEPKDGEPRLHIKEQPAPVQVDIEILASALKNAPLAPSDNQGRPRAPVVPPAIEPDYKVIKSILPTANPDEYACCIAADMWNACRAAMLQGAEAVSNRDELPLDYLQGHKDGLEWAAQLAEANHPQTGDWLYDDPIELARAIRKGPDMPTVQAGNSPATQDGWISCSERMPNEEDVLVYCSDTKEQMVGFHKGKGLFQFFYMNGVEGVCEPSHWMPLPEPPL